MTLRTTLQDTLARTAGPPTLLVVSDSHAGPMLASAFEPTADVRLVTDHRSAAGQLLDGTQVTVGDVTSLETLADAVDADAAVVALRRDRRAVLVTQLLRTHFDLETVVAVLNDPQRREAVEDIATTVVCGSTLLATELRREIERSLPAFEPA
ncbi:NAD-binding protein [Haloarcula nitratireducens]|uniref:NAD-binding protein n=1 Tax=Haloarcula nitratireducens TaxID=2487749 RepID=A0AAW4P8E1_9EURY|nr:NAD-binding protein [Halomicroarcula nitratireducens]MBX0294321.1 NAD-binding protein [Halomicroarcula nitratireducens]